MMRNTSPLSFRKSTVVASIRVRSGSPFCVDFKATIHLTFNLHIFDLPVDGVYAMFFQEIIRLAERPAAKESTVRR